MKNRSTSRREFLGGAVATGLMALGAKATAESISGGKMWLAEAVPRTSAPMDAAEFRRRLVGPIQSQPTPIAENFAVDYDGIRKVVGRGLSYGVKIFELTAGNSQYFALSYDEI